MSARKKTPATTRPATGTGTSGNPVTEPVAGVPVLRTGAEKALWAVLVDYPGSGAAELAGAAGIGGSTARRILSGWAAAGAARRDRDPDNPRVAERWSPTTEPATDATEPGPGSQLPQPQTMAQPGGETGSTAAEPADTAPDPVSESTGDDRPASPATDPDGSQCAGSGSTDDEPGAPAVDVCAAGGDAAAADEKSPVRLAAGMLRGQVEDFLRDHPDGEFSPHEIGKALVRSSGAVHNALAKLTTLGAARQTSTQPKKFALASPTR